MLWEGCTRLVLACQEDGKVICKRVRSKTNCVFVQAMPYFHACFVTAMLVNCAKRDDKRMRQKYHKYWEAHCKRVRYKLIPFIYWLKKKQTSTRDWTVFCVYKGLPMYSNVVCDIWHLPGFLQDHFGAFSYSHCSFFRTSLYLFNVRPIFKVSAQVGLLQCWAGIRIQLRTAQVFRRIPFLAKNQQVFAYCKNQQFEKCLGYYLP